MFRCEASFSGFLTKFLSSCPSSIDLYLLPWKICCCAAALSHYSFCKTLHPKCLTVFEIRLSRLLLSNLYTDLVSCTSLDKFRMVHFQKFSFSFSSCHIKENLRIFKTMTHSTPDTYLEPSQRFKIEFFEKSS